MAKIKFFMSGDGTTLRYLHSDVLPMDKFGRKEVDRASDVEFDAISQEWIATLMDGREIARHSIRDEVLKQERSVIDDMLARGEQIPGVPA